ncbi:hypothetical protein [Erythrobacter sp. R86502]|uniref:hypothetical protein n=1 Tax=Erythrobacter sp. R86502 TaxID=3093846 RepID=UPI0036D34AA8
MNRTPFAVLALVRFTVLLRPHSEQLVIRYSERAECDMPVIMPADSAGLVSDW